MKNCTVLRPRKFGSLQKILLLSILMGTLMLLFLSVTWSYQKIHSGIGEEAAQVTTSLQVVVILVLAMTGLGLGYLVDWSIRRQRFIFRTPQQSICADAIVRFWGYKLNYIEEAVIQAMANPDLPCTLEEILIIPDKPKRRGRKPTFTLERWLPIAAKWENRDPMRDAFTLGELIAEQLGTNSDGTPIVSEQAYYTTWRPRAIQELQRKAKARQKAFDAKNTNLPSSVDPEM
jgi:hypothetical protein